MSDDRFVRIQKEMAEQGIEQLFVCSTSSIFYLTGRWIDPGERLLTLYLDRSGRRILFVNELFPVAPIPGVEMRFHSDADNPLSELGEVVDPASPLGIEKTWPSHFLLDLMALLPGLRCVNGSSVIDRVRMIKDGVEISAMKRSSEINDQAMAEIVRMIAPDSVERELVRLFPDIYERHGADSMAFAIVAFGSNAADPHHGSGKTRIKPGDSVILDIGCYSGRYCSDMTRTVFFGEPAEEAKKVYSVVREANLRAIETIQPGVRFCEIDRAARGVIEKAGYGKQFTHRTGHNIGIDVHEFPDVGPVNEMPVRPGMIFSIEPGIYLPGRLGVRLEDLVLVTEDGCEVLNGHTKDLQVAG